MMHGRILRAIAKRRTLRAWIDSVPGYRSLLCSMSPAWLVRHRYKLKMGKRLDLKSPTTFDEKLLWLMLHWKDPAKTRCADKYAVRSYVEEKGLGRLLARLLGVYERSTDIDYDALPDRFALKCNHGWGCNVICSDKSRLDRNETCRRLDKWLRTDFSRLTGEIHYAAIKPRIICEEFLGDGTGVVPIDYKIYCFHGRAHCTMVCTGRGLATGTKFDFYNRDWTAKLPYSRSSLLAQRSIAKPEGYDDMLLAAELLSAPFPFVRMDFYSVGGRVVFGEMTFTPDACVDTGYTDIAQRELGTLITLPEELP
jgi:hypothetical protein